MNKLVRALIVTLGLLVTGSTVAPVPPPMVRAPVMFEKDDGLLLQLGWFEYKESKTFDILYCIKDGDTKLVCVAKVRLADGSLAIVWLEDIPASHLRT